MDAEDRRKVSRREVISRLIFGITGAAFTLALPPSMRDSKREKFLKNISDRDAAYYRRLAG